jgi:hypothetical protein
VEPQEAAISAWAKWNSEIPGPLRDYAPSGDPLSDQNPKTGEWESRIPLPENARGFLGQEAAILLAARARA